LGPTDGAVDGAEGLCCSCIDEIGEVHRIEAFMVLLLSPFHLWTGRALNFMSLMMENGNT
jgi:hypothetical protein